MNESTGPLEPIEPISLSVFSHSLLAGLSARNVTQLITGPTAAFHEACFQAYVYLAENLNDGPARLAFDLDYDLHKETYAGFSAMVIFWIRNEYAYFIRPDRLQLCMNAETGGRILLRTGEPNVWLGAVDTLVDRARRQGHSPVLRG